ncbi:DUF4810 domain-containing protein [Pseudomonas piscis]|uniref:DUF4810 domain-containing protein n=1 Tax=Pseudomonas piscis TaxID=2614538 RepID=UPI0021D5F485|nr:DUF4810 domain-containing protein [Pseudomonas piscis]MCU7647334.1 DUF4810 domain-containing protein [Pseudomonas piscis]
MFKIMMARPALAAVVLGSVLLAGCSGPKTLYQWESYQAQTYEYFKGEGAREAQVEALERDLQKIKSTGKAVPPGYHAHLGMLYAGLGKDDQMVQQFNTEKALFPESAKYMDFLLKNAKQGTAQ